MAHREISPGRYRLEAGGRVYTVNLSGGLVVRISAQRKGKFAGAYWRELPRGGPAFMKAVALWEKEA